MSYRYLKAYRPIKPARVNKRKLSRTSRIRLNEYILRTRRSSEELNRKLFMFKSDNSGDLR